MDNKTATFQFEHKAQEEPNGNKTTQVDSSSVQINNFNFQLDCEEEYDVIRSNN